MDEFASLQPELAAAQTKLATINAHHHAVQMAISNTKSPEARNLLEQALTQDRQARAAVEEQIRVLEALLQKLRKHLIAEMNASATKLGWSAEEQARLNTTLNKLGFDGNPEVTVGQIKQAWQIILARGSAEDLARKASQGQGPGFPGTGQQSHEDCAIFALANAAGLPYGVVAARANEIISQGTWRGDNDRANPQKAIEEKGLLGGEVVLLAESFGQAEVVSGADFASTLLSGRPILVSLVPRDGNFNRGHEVVLTKTFLHEGEPWFEMIDSNQAGTRQRLYLSAKELATIQKESGVAFRPEPSSTPQLLR